MRPHRVARDDGSRVELRMTGIADGDLAIGGPADTLATRRQAVVDAPWTWLRQVHGDRVVVVETPGGGAGEEADAAVTAVPGVVLAVHTADCAPLALVGRGGFGLVHAGWRGLTAGVVARAVEAVTSLGGPVTHTVLGPCIGPECYEFGEDDLDKVVAAIGPAARGRTSSGAPALDLPAAVAASLARVGAPPPVRLGGCTACEPGWFSHRARSDAGRQALVAWQEPEIPA